MRLQRSGPPQPPGYFQDKMKYPRIKVVELEKLNYLLYPLCSDLPEITLVQTFLFLEFCLLRYIYIYLFISRSKLLEDIVYGKFLLVMQKDFQVLK